MIRIPFSGFVVAHALTTLVLLSLVPVLSAVEQPATWKPHDHPASIERSITGFTRPRRVVMVAAEVPGRVTAVALDVGQRVGPEQVAAIVTIDDTQAVIARDQAVAALTASEQASRAAALAGQAAEADAGLRGRTAARTKNLADQGKLSVEEADTTATAAELARIEAERAKVTESQASTAVIQARLDLARANDHLSRHRVPAPGGWLVAQRLVEPGTMVAAGTPLLRVIDTTTLVVELHLTSDELAALRAQAMPIVRFPRHGDRRASVTLARIDPEFDPLTRKHRVELDLAGDAAPEPIGGLEVALSFPVPDPSGALLIPASFIRTVGERQRVSTSDGKELVVTVIRQAGDYVAVLPSALPVGVELKP
ncbi:MAG: HlyD family efflux transporter periplasmic adaptor subunit [Planctomycetes bacterium]|nr:HlyD family efflux transporter periplasmic adaptor subunit [Planctomycetota bacterium]